MSSAPVGVTERPWAAATALDVAETPVSAAPGSPPTWVSPRVAATVAKGAVVMADAVTVALAAAVAFALWNTQQDVPDLASPRPQHLVTALLLVPCWLVAFARVGLYRQRHVAEPMNELRRIVSGALLGTVVTLAAAATVKVDPARLWLSLTVPAGIAAVAVERQAVRHVFQARRRRGHHRKPVLIVGTNEEAVSLRRLFDTDRSLGYAVVGHLATASASGPERDLLVAGRADAPLAALRATGATGVVIATTSVDQATINRLTRELTDAGVHVELSSSLQDVAARRLSIRPVGRLSMTYVEPTVLRGWRMAAKRAFDVTVAVTGLVVLSPVLAAAALGVKLDSRGPVLFRQPRVGRNGVTFEVFKLRTMVIDAESMLEQLRTRNEAAWPLFKVRDDPRVTRVGRVLRRYSIDEVPQLLNVIRGEMSLVGPRPALPEEAATWEPGRYARLRVRPGITGMWQVKGRSNASAEDALRLDLSYVENWSLCTDLAILAWTVPAVVSARGAY
jgi:exopolysaccharide biosynthesis polyprenyl glycosylphosphotransferase